MAFLRIQGGSDKGQRVQIDRDEVVIGRSPDALLRIDDPSVSGHHCAIARQGRRFMLKDLGSTNGTRLNGVRVDTYQLGAKDIITAGTVDVLFDGDDIEDHLAEEIPPTIVRPATGRHAAVRAEPAAFSQRQSSKGTWIGLSVVVGLCVLAALGWFLHNLLRSG